jgi:sulfatase maturation enzyme AslB (radical SAM superfamily)
MQRFDERSSPAGEAAPKPPAREWNASKRWNPFNSYKLLAHVPRWRNIKRGKPIPAPILVTIDPTNVCNFGCVWCNAAQVRSQRSRSLSEATLSRLADFLPRWGEGNGAWKPGVEAICVAGGGEPLMNPGTAGFIDRVADHGIEIGVVTNGTLVAPATDALSRCTWVGVSMDAGTAKTFDALKALDPARGTFDKVVDNIANLVDYAKRHNNRLGFRHPAYGVSFKYLLYKENVGEILEATRLAKRIGCKNIHFRPAATPWDRIGGDDPIRFTPDEVRLFREQIEQALALDDETFNVYGVTHKFTEQFDAANFFTRCHAIFMTAVIAPPASESSPEDAFVLGLCCDRRGDPKLELGAELGHPSEIDRVWGSEKHWRIHDAIRIAEECPRCTYQPHNEIYEQVILNDSMTYKFI